MGSSGPLSPAHPSISPLDRAPERSTVTDIDAVAATAARCIEDICDQKVIATKVVPLHPVLCQVMDVVDAGPLSDVQEKAIGAREPVFERCDSPDHLDLTVPFVWDESSLALVEFRVPRSALAHARVLRSLVTGLGALGFQRSIEAHGARLQTDRLSHQVTLGEALLAASSVAGVATATVQFWNERADGPAAVWVLDEGSGRMVLVASVGLDLQQIPPAARVLPPWDECLPAERDGVQRLFPVDPGSEISVLAFERLLLMVACREAPERYLLASMAPFLKLAVERCGSIDKERRRNRETEAGMACAIHEVRGSLLAARNALEVVRTRGGNLFLLERSRDELQRTSQLAEILLRCCKGFVDLDFRQEDLAKIVMESVESCLLESGDREVVVSGPESLPIVAEEHSLRSAIVNVIRNALAYSSDDSSVEIACRVVRDSVEIRTTAPGPRIAEDERHLLFEPYFRGRGSAGSEGGSGLGLFLARRVVEAHGGSIRAYNDDGLTSFVITIPYRSGDKRRQDRRRRPRRAPVVS